ncbi:MAG: 3-dehydroquinate synthase [Granulosicoccus sp.]
MLAPRPIADNSHDTAWQNFSVSFSYPVSFTQELFAQHNLTLLHTLQLNETNKRHKIIIFIDEGVASARPNLVERIQDYTKAYEQHIQLVCPPIIMVAGEAIKSDDRQVRSMQESIARHRVDRHSFVIGIGGGALLDAVGLAAATAHRGIRHIRVPTTVLAQNDSGVGVKNSVNQFEQKNYLGTFAPPFAVLNDYEFIRSLSRRDKIAGMAEAVKVALIRDAAFYQWLEDNARALSEFEESAMRYMIRRCAELHMHQIAQGGDPFESGSARPLDFGHWAAHRLESLTHYELRHGEAVAIGIALDTRYSVLSGLLAAGADTRVCHLLQALGFELWHEALDSRNDKQEVALIQGLTDFKEHLGGELTITLLEGIGQGVEVNSIDTSLVDAAITWLRARDNTCPTSLKLVSSCAPGSSDDTNATGSSAAPVNVIAVTNTLTVWLQKRLSAKQFEWLNQRVSLLKESSSDRDLHITLGLIPRRLGHADLALTPEQVADAQANCGVSWDPSEWTVDNAARCLILTTLFADNATRFYSLFGDLCATAELNEAIALYRCTSVIPADPAMDQPLGAGLRTHIRAIFEAIAHRNPYPAAHFDQHRWNHMVLKTLFIDSHLWPIQDLDRRANAELASILCDYAHERWAAKRAVTPELWRCVGPFATDNMLDDLNRVIASKDVLEQQAGVLALLSAPGYDQQQLSANHAQHVAMIKSGEISWESIGRRYSAHSS